MSEQKKELVHLTVIITTSHVKDTGEEFRKASVKGQYVNTAALNHDKPIDNTVRYTIRGVDKILKEHKRDGKYRLYFPMGSAWVDERPDKIDKHIIRIKDIEVVEWRGELKQDREAKQEDGEE